jgi:hypothetical protein
VFVIGYKIQDSGTEVKTVRIGGETLDSMGPVERHSRVGDDALFPIASVSPPVLVENTM